MTDNLRDRLAESITDAIETILDQHEFMHNTSRCSCGLRNNMDGDILDLHRISLIGETVRNTLTTPGIAVVELPAKITTADELDALPFLTVIREIRPRRGIDYGGIYERRTSGWQCIAGTWVEPERNGGPTLPVMVLWRGKDER